MKRLLALTALSLLAFTGCASPPPDTPVAVETTSVAPSSNTPAHSPTTTKREAGDARTLEEAASWIPCDLISTQDGSHRAGSCRPTDGKLIFLYEFASVDVAHADFLSSVEVGESDSLFIIGSVVALVTDARGYERLDGLKYAERFEPQP